MATFDQRIDTYIALSSITLRPILLHLRRLIHIAVPEITETMNRSFPHFKFYGRVCSLEAYEDYCTLHFWNANGISKSEKEHFKHIGNIDDLPSDDVIVGYLKGIAMRNRSTL